MSERQEHKKRYNLKLEYVVRMDKWLSQEPPMRHIFKWHKWKRQRPAGWKGALEDG